MTISKTYGIVGVIVALLLGLFGGNALGGVYSTVTQDFAQGISINGVTIFDGSGNLTIASGDTLTVNGTTVVETLTEGGGIRATSTDDTTATFLAADFDVENMIEFTPNVTGITATLPASSTLSSFVPNAGDHRELILCNATTTANASFTLGFGAGMNAQQATSTLAIPDGECAVLDFYRATDTDLEVFYDLGF